MSSARLAWLGLRAALGATAGVRLARAAGRAPPVEPDLAPLVDTTVSVIVPARNEAARIGPLLEALQAEPTAHQLVVVDDQSSDGTARRAARAGVHVVPGAPLPDGWVGKSWALEQGLAVADGEWVIALDADTIPRPGLPAALVRRCRTDGWDLLSVGGRFLGGGFPQRVLHPALLTSLVYRFGPPGARHQPRAARTMANGQCMVFRRDRLLTAGGFEAVAGHLSDDVALAHHLVARGWRVGFLDGTAVLAARMYGDAHDAWVNWGRSLALPDVTERGAQAWDLALVWAAQALPLARLVVGRGDALDVALLGLRLGTLVGTRRAYAQRGLAYWLSPLADIPVAARLTQAALRPERAWRGRTYRPRSRLAGAP